MRTTRDKIELEFVHLRYRPLQLCMSSFSPHFTLYFDLEESPLFLDAVHADGVEQQTGAGVAGAQTPAKQRPDDRNGRAREDEGLGEEERRHEDQYEEMRAWLRLISAKANVRVH